MHESYGSLLNTANQIKQRLQNSLSKFQEYEDMLESIWINLEQLEPPINSKVEKPYDLETASSLLESMKVYIYNTYTYN